MSGYTSDRLTHFVGSSVPDNHEANWDRLKTIVASGEVRVGGAIAEPRIKGVTWAHMTRRSDKPLSSNERYLASVVCFADIPDDLLDIHVAKYGAFGLGFTKTFLLDQGVRPVTYLPRTATTGVFANRPTVEEDWDSLVAVFERAVHTHYGGKAGAASEDEQTEIEDWFDFGVMAYAKFYDPLLPDNDAENYYLEREWRSTSNVTFEPSDVATLYVARGWAHRVPDEIPGFAGQVVQL